MRQDYDPLAAALREKGLLVETAKIARLDWGRNALGLLDVNYYRGTLQPRPVVDWCALCSNAGNAAAGQGFATTCYAGQKLWVVHVVLS